MTWAYIHLEPHMHTDCSSNNKQTHRGLIVFSIWRASPVSLSLRYQANSSVARMSFILLTGTSLSDSQAAQQQGILYLILLFHQLHTTAIHYTKHAVAWHIISQKKKCHFCPIFPFTSFQIMYFLSAQFPVASPFVLGQTLFPSCRYPWFIVSINIDVFRTGIETQNV